MVSVSLLGMLSSGCGSSGDEAPQPSTAEKALPGPGPDAANDPLLLETNESVDEGSLSAAVEPAADGQPAEGVLPADASRETELQPVRPDPAGIDDPSPLADPPDPEGAAAAEQPQPLPAPEGAQRMSQEYQVWFDPQRKRVMVDGTICLRQGVLELLACQTKTHEAVVKLHAPPSVVHAGLLLAGAETGAPAVFYPEYRPPTGSEIMVMVRWIDKEGQPHEIDARQFVRSVKSREALEHNWVFSGSRFEKAADTGEELYMADNYDDFICISNFPTAMMDLPLKSTAQVESLLFEAFTENIPPLGTPVRLILIPQPAAAERP
ncbi:MAG: hypothetical protein GTO53_12770 [Planctomycetales bacterium]|nr:hypothetical protein [Planctomycetales bacterium]NIN78519.1 hypothetical protein [Planctomycetales bacterium]